MSLRTHLKLLVELFFFQHFALLLYSLGCSGVLCVLFKYMIETDDSKEQSQSVVLKPSTSKSPGELVYGHSWTPSQISLGINLENMHFKQSFLLIHMHNALGDSLL